MKPTRKTRKELRNFGLVMAVPLALLGGVLWWKGSGWFPYALGASAAFLLAGLLVPEVLRPIEKGWMKVALVMSAVMTRVILTLAFFLVLTPMGLLLRLLGKRPLQIRRDASRTSYWIPVEPDGPGTRPDKPY